MKIGLGEVGISQSAFRLKTECIARVCEALFILTEILIDETQVPDGSIISRINLRPEFIHRASLIQIADDKFVVEGIDIELLSFSDQFAKLVGFRQVLRRAVTLTQIRIARPPKSVGDGELRDEL